MDDEITRLRRVADAACGAAIAFERDEGDIDDERSLDAAMRNLIDVLDSNLHAPPSISGGPCPHRAAWQIWDVPESPDGNTLACSDHVGHLLTDDGGAVVPFGGDGPCCYIEPGNAERQAAADRREGA